MSSYMKSLTPSEETKPVSFKHIPFNVKIQYPFESAKFIGMIAGGTGECCQYGFLLLTVVKLTTK